MVSMYCPNCGREVEEGKPCVCQTAPPNIQPPAYNPYPPMYQPPVINTAPATSAVAVLRKHGSSPLMMVLAIILSVGCVTSLLSVIIMGNNLDFTTTYSDLGVNFNAQGFEAIKAMMIVGSVFAFIPAVLTAISVWLFHFACKKPKNQFVSTTGLTIAKVVKMVVSIGALAFLTLYLGLVIILGIATPSLSNQFADGYMSQFLGIGVAILLIIMLALMVYLILDLVFFIKTVGAVRQTAQTGMANCKISMYLIVVNIIAGVFMAIAAFSSLTTTGPFGLLASGINAAAPIIAAVVLLKYRGEMTDLIVRESAAIPFNPNMYNQQVGVTCNNCHVIYDPNMDVCPNCGTNNHTKFNVNR